MMMTMTVVFDGKVFLPELPLNLEPNKRYIITIQNVLPSIIEGDAWDVLEQLIGSLEAPEDWAKEHDHYLYGTPKHHIEDIG